MAGTREELNWRECLFPQRKYHPTSFEEVRRVLSGERIELDASSRKVLAILLGYQGGCDVVISGNDFQVMAATALKPGELTAETAPAVVSELLTLAGIVAIPLCTYSVVMLYSCFVWLVANFGAG